MVVRSADNLDHARMEHVTSTDGTTIAFERSGSGSPVLLVHGSLNDRHAWALVTPAFAAHYTVYAMDRRGRGESGAPRDHAIERQFEDVAAVIEAIGEPVALVGHSYGAQCALGAAALLPDRVRALVLYEPPSPAMAASAIGGKFESEDASAAVEDFFLNGVGVPKEQVDLMKTTPYWPWVLQFVPTMASEIGALAAYRFDAARFAALRMPVLFLDGSDSTDELRSVMRELQPHLTQSKWVTFEGQGHGAVLTAPDLFAQHVLDFLR